MEATQNEMLGVIVSSPEDILRRYINDFVANNNFDTNSDNKSTLV